jgi:hypothetical protein
MVQATETKTWRVKPDTQNIDSDIIEVWESMNGDLCPNSQSGELSTVQSFRITR